MLRVITIAEDEEFLRQVSKEVDFNDSDLENNIKDIKEYCLNHNVYAMAAIQFGIAKRIVYIKSTKPNDTSADDEGKQVVMLNPKVISMEGETEFWEACASGLDNFSLVDRPYKLEVEYYDINGDKYLQKFEGFAATVVSHELDHLDGVFHMDRAKKSMKMPKEKRFDFREAHPYKIISKTGKFEYEKVRRK